MALDYAPAPTVVRPASIRSSYGVFIDGEFRGAGSGEDGAGIVVVDPATETPLTEVVDAGAGTVADAAASARRAFSEGWAAMPGSERARYLYRIAAIVEERAGDLAALETTNTGKPIRETRDGDLPLVVAHSFHHAGWADKLRYASSADPRPHGVTAALISCHAPLLSLIWGIAPALACGNTVVLKPSAGTPLTALAFAEICQAADLPPGVVNVVTGTGATGGALIRQPDVDAVTFTGAAATLAGVLSALAGTGTPVNADAGTKAINIVFDDAPIDEAVDGILESVVSGGRGVAWRGSLLFAQENIADDLLAMMRLRMEALRVGDPLDRNTDVGPLRRASQVTTATTVRRGCEPCAEDEGWSPACRLPARGFWFAPTLLTSGWQTSAIARQEVFGPLLGVRTFRTPAEAIGQVNATSGGLSCGVWTEKGSRFHAVAQRLRASTIWANAFGQYSPSALSGGYGLEGHLAS